MDCESEISLRTTHYESAAFLTKVAEKIQAFGIFVGGMIFVGEGCAKFFKCHKRFLRKNFSSIVMIELTLCQTKISFSLHLSCAAIKINRFHAKGV